MGQITSLSPDSKIDTLLQLISKDKEDTNKVNHLILLSREYSVKNADTSYRIANSAFQLATQLGWRKGIANSNIAMGWSYYILGNGNASLECNFKALKIGEEEDNKLIKLYAYSNIGHNYYAQGDGYKALEYNKKALRIAQETADDWNIARNLGIIGTEYQLISNYSKALEHFFKAYILTEKIGNKNGSGLWLSNIGSTYLKLKEYDSALLYLEKGAFIFDSIGNKLSFAETVLEIGNLHLFKKNYRLSYNFFIDALNIGTEVGATECQRDAYEALSRLYRGSDIGLPDSIGMYILSKEQMRLQALSYFQKYISFRDSLFNTENQKKSLNIEFQNQFAISKIEQDKKDAIIKQQILQQKIIRNSFVVGTILLLFLIIVLINRNKLKRSVEIEKIRSRLSRDLHDDIGSTLSSINILSHTAQTHLDPALDEKTKLTLEKINERCQRLLDSMGDIIWNINPGNDTMEEVMSRMREYASTLLEAKHIDYTFNFPDETMECKLSMEVKNNMYLIFKEAINNLSKYSNCTKAWLSLTFNEKNIHLKIEDNGRGFKEDEIVHRGGLRNMQHRAEEIKGILKIESTINEGTKIELTMPRYC